MEDGREERGGHVGVEGLRGYTGWFVGLHCQTNLFEKPGSFLSGPTC